MQLFTTLSVQLSVPLHVTLWLPLIVGVIDPNNDVIVTYRGVAPTLLFNPDIVIVYGLLSLYAVDDCTYVYIVLNEQLNEADC